MLRVSCLRIQQVVRSAFPPVHSLWREVPSMRTLGRLLGFGLCSSWTVSFLLGIVACLSVVPGALLSPEPSAAQTVTPQCPALPSETPTKIQPVIESFDYVRREVMI